MFNNDKNEASQNEKHTQLETAESNSDHSEAKKKRKRRKKKKNANEDGLNSNSLDIQKNAAPLNSDIQQTDSVTEDTTPSKKKRRRKRKSSEKITQDLEGGVNQAQNKKIWVGGVDEVQESDDLYKYWTQRYRLFSRFDEGVQLDTESWYSATPELIASHIAQRCACGIIVDAFCGAGGNAIQFAFTCERVIAIDIDPIKIQMAKINAQIYGVADRIEFIVGDFFQLAPSLKADVVFLSPPWGGPSYLDSAVFDLKTMQPYDGFTIFKAARTISESIAYLLPRNTNKEQLAHLSVFTKRCRSCELEQNVINQKVKTITVYYGDLIDNQVPVAETVEDIDQYLIKNFTS